ncbi:Slp family lipoprotein [Candidatus Methylacidiphilum infernorum]|uniref:Slp family lipoprotein n=1 Tax=Candidatus Methylacidiphilum infernorum TaxID=511746 RepID=A0ABX7PV66_9BACT|nr:Slp family lipoprotein [Candidatus Methylacidiphilum infernorum]QSR86573.1 Slp family lipoprotein [Candidatus Methylacidiphilum infernorum]
MLKNLLFLLALSSLGSIGFCSIIPKDLLNQYKNQPPLETILQKPEGYQDRFFLVGGKILSNEPLEDRTELLIEQRKLSHSGKPVGSSSKNKRLILIITKDFLDPNIYTEGRLVTAYGKITVRKLGKEKKIYLAARSIYLWPQFNPIQGGYIGGGPVFFF